MKTRVSVLILAMLVSLLVSACATPPAPLPLAQAPVDTPVPAPTLTPAPVALPILVSSAPGAIKSGITIRMSAGDKCTMEGPASIAAGVNAVQWIVESSEHDVFGLTFVTLEPGRTIDDLRAVPPQKVDPPRFAHWNGQFFESQPGGSKQIEIQVPTGEGPIYFACFYRPPEIHFATLGPVEVKSTQ